MATPLGIRIGCNSFLLQDFPFLKVLGVLGLQLLAPISIFIFKISPNDIEPTIV